MGSGPYLNAGGFFRTTEDGKWCVQDIFAMTISLGEGGTVGQAHQISLKFPNRIERSSVLLVFE